MKFVLLHPVTFTPSLLSPEAGGIATHEVRSHADLQVGESRTAFLLDPASRAGFPASPLPSFVDAGGAGGALGAPNEVDVPEDLQDVVAAYVPQPPGVRQVLVALRTAYREATARAEAARGRLEAAARSKELSELREIGGALSTQR